MKEKKIIEINRRSLNTFEVSKSLYFSVTKDFPLPRILRDLSGVTF